MSFIEVNRYHLFLSSSSSSSSSNFSFILKKPIILTHPSHYFKLIVKQVSIPYAFQNVNPNYNTLKYTITRNNTTYSSQIVTINNGNYNVYDLLNAVSNSLTSSISSLISGFTPIFNFTYNTDTMLASFNLTNNDSIATSITLYSDLNQVGSMLGISSNISFGYNASNLQTTGYSISPVNCSPISQIFIRSTTLKQGQNVEFLNSSQYTDYSNILAVVPLFTQPRSWVQFYDLNLECDLINNTINEINLFLTDSRNNLLNLDLKGLGWNCTITLIEARHIDLENDSTYWESIKIGNQLRNGSIQNID
jgi:hypothetical protein